MQKNIALSMKDHYLNFYHRYDGGRLEELDIKLHGYDFMGHISFLFDRRDSHLIISGDYGNAIFCWGSERNTLENIRDYSQDLAYFASKCLTTDCPTYEYDEEKARKDIKRWLNNRHIDPDDWGNLDSNSELFMYDGPDELVDKLADCIDPKRGLNLKLSFFTDPDDLEEALDWIDSDWQEDAEYWGKKISDSIQVWAHALNLGIRWKKQQEKKDEINAID